MKYNILLILFCSLLLFAACIGDDVLDDAVDPVLRISNPIDSLELGSSYALMYNYFNNVGQPEIVDAVWSSSAPDIISINDQGLAEGLQLGSAQIELNYTPATGPPISTSLSIGVGENTVLSSGSRSGSIVSSSSYLLQGDFELLEVPGNALQLRFAENYAASTALPGLYVYLTNNPETNVGALEIGRVTVFSGAHDYSIADVGINEYGYVLFYCKPFNVKVGDGKINE